MAEGKPKRLRPWLEGLLNRGDVPGLQWIDDEKTMFRITWKHHGKQDWSPDHGRVFMVSVSQILIACARRAFCTVWVRIFEHGSVFFRFL